MTYESIKNQIAESGEELPISAKNDKLTTVQNNNWCRINCYYADGTIDETYER